MNITILAIESSCDETAASVIKNGHILSNVIATQTVHANYGGVVPELASRAHQQNIIPVINDALTQANINKSDLSAMAFTQGPGLLGALLVGSSFSKAMALALDIPLIGVNHMQAHILAHFIEDPKPQFPFLCLTVSGGHTQIVLVKNYLDMEIIGQTRDDAVGEAFDKSAKILGMDYPGGPLIDKHAMNGNPLAYEFSKANIPDYDFSFSGIKTSILYFLRDQKKLDPDFIKDNFDDICASIQHSLVNMLLEKLTNAANDLGINQIAIAGGVSANSGLRKSLKELAVVQGWNVFIPKFEYCTDNAAMIAMAAHYKFLKKEFVTQDAVPEPRMKFGGK